MNQKMFLQESNQEDDIQMQINIIYGSSQEIRFTIYACLFCGIYFILKPCLFNFNIYSLNYFNKKWINFEKKTLYTYLF